MGIFPHCFKLSWLTERDRKQSVFLSFSWRTQMFKLNSGKGNKHFHMKSTHWGLHPSHQLIYTTVNQSAGHIKTYNMYIWNGMVFDIQCEMQQDWNLTMQTRESKSLDILMWSRLGLHDILHAIVMHISSVKPVPWLALNLHHLFSNGAAFNTQSRRSLTSYAISRSISQAIHLRFWARIA